MPNERFLFSGFLKTAANYPDRPAVVVEGATFTYKQLYESAKRIAATIRKMSPDPDPKLTAVFAYRSPTAFAGVLGVLLAGLGYVPLNRTFPTARTNVMLQRAGCRSMIVDHDSTSQLKTVLQDIEKPMLLLFPDQSGSEELQARWHPHIAIGGDELEPAIDWCHPSGEVNDIAYLLFTSGSTGIPKGVMVAHRNVVPFIDAMVERYQINEKDRLSQMFDMTFDLSVFDMFLSWERGACVCCPTQKTLMKPGSFIKEQQLTLWFSVPSTVVFMNRLSLMKPNAYPSLRWSLFCGEPLPVESIKSWAVAAPNSIIENLYGPTELTIACTLYRWEAGKSDKEAEMGIVPIGYPYPNMEILVVDEKLNEVLPGCKGELLMTGPQMTLGYFRDQEKTNAVFVVPPGKTKVYYRTGDRVRRPVGDAPLTHLGRVDFQVKIGGHRVELGEIEEVIRKISSSNSVVAVPWPLTASGADGIEVFIEGERPVNLQELHRHVQGALPVYMVPKRWHFLNEFPLNVNGKIDRKALAKRLEANDSDI